MKKISILGSTGSIGTQTLDVISKYPNNFSAIALSAGNNIQLFKKQIKIFHPKTVSVENESDAKKLKTSQAANNIYFGEEGNIKVATYPEAEIVVIATPGLPGIKPTLEAIKKGKTIALATKEVLVAAGEIITKKALKSGTQILPIDSEHSAILQCLAGRKAEDIENIYLTCSGGPFLGLKSKDLKKVTLKQALNHPRWKMGKKITVDSATLMNKGFEVIEAHWLFGIPLEKIKVIIHPESVIHSVVEFKDGSLIAQIGPADMHLPIQYALFYPNPPKNNYFKKFSFLDYPTLHFGQADQKTFRCLSLTYQAAKIKGTATVVLNAANDICVEQFLLKKLPFFKIAEIIENTLEKHKFKAHPSLDQIFEIDLWAREYANRLITKL